MEISVINDIKRKSKDKRKEDSPIIEKDSPIKVNNIDFNISVKEFKNIIYEKLNLKNQVSRSRLGIMFVLNKDDKEIKTFLSDDLQKLSFYEEVDNPDTIFHIKDIGPQINYRLVYVLEYLGPLVLSVIFFLRYVSIYKKMNPESNLQVHVCCYFIMTVFHYTKRILESLYVHIFSRTTMPLSNLFKNCAYYWGIFGLLCGYTLFDPYGKDLTFMVFPRYIFILFFIGAEMENLKTHSILREMKINGKGKKIMPPKTDGFQYVTCANYMWEFFAWLSFSLFSLNICVALFTLCGFIQMMQWAKKKHYEMKKLFGDSYPKDLYAFIPSFI